MRSLIVASAVLAATALSSPVFAPITAHAQGQQTTGAERDLRQGLRAHQSRHWSAKRHQIIRAERGTPNSTRGSGY
jgi:hypothetical protein